MSRRRYTLRVAALALAGACAAFGSAAPPQKPAAPAPKPAAQTAKPAAVPLPNKEGSLKFGVLGDFGTGSRQQYELGEQMAKVHAAFPFELVITVGDNIYGGQRPQDMKKKFEDPYKGVLAAGVKFYASLGNHDDRAQSRYKLFNMEGRTYYSFKAPKQDVRFFALETDYLRPEQIAWLQKELDSSGEAWKIPYFHHPLYSSGKRHGSDLDIRTVLEPLFLEAGVSVVFAGHDHFYERTKPQKDVVHFVVGSGGQLRRGNIDRKSPLTAMGFDTDQAFLVAEIDGDQLVFNTISRTGAVIDSGVIERRKPARP
jgi:diadenosine tetraphosphatase ApaH/serine/threonine PP2A family protein phosphatase